MNIGLLGFGSMGRTHSYSIANLNFFYGELPFEAKIAGVCTRNFENAQKAARVFSLGKAYKDEDEMINDPSIDVIDICTPNLYHYDAIKKAVNAGKHVYCEKPLCVTYAQAAEVAALVKEKGVTAQIVFNNRWMAPSMKAKELITSGALGDILSFRIAYLHSSCADPDKKAGWKQNSDICGGGVLFDLGSHIIDLIYYLCGEFDEVTGMSKIAYPTRKGMDGDSWETNADEAFYMMAKLKSGATGTIEASKITVGANDDLTFEIYGTRGSVRFDLMEPNWLHFYDNTIVMGSGELGGGKGFQKIECVGRYPAPGGIFPGVKAPVGWLRGHITSMHNFLSAAHAGKTAYPSFDDAAHVQKVMEAAYASDKSRTWEKI